MAGSSCDIGYGSSLMGQTDYEEFNSLCISKQPNKFYVSSNLSLPHKPSLTSFELYSSNKPYEICNSSYIVHDIQNTRLISQCDSGQAINIKEAKKENNCKFELEDPWCNRLIKSCDGMNVDINESRSDKSRFSDKAASIHDVISTRCRESKMICPNIYMLPTSIIKMPPSILSAQRKLAANPPLTIRLTSPTLNKRVKFKEEKQIEHPNFIIEQHRSSLADLNQLEQLHILKNSSVKKTNRKNNNSNMTNRANIYKSCKSFEERWTLEQLVEQMEVMRQEWERCSTCSNSSESDLEYNYVELAGGWNGGNVYKQDEKMENVSMPTNKHTHKHCILS